jgi:hypothetical protein
MIANFRKE